MRSRVKISSASLVVLSSPTWPRPASIVFKVILSARDAACWSKDSPSRKLPSASEAMSSIASLSMLIFSVLAIDSSFLEMSATVWRVKWKRWVRLVMVAGTLSSSVVARIKMAWAGGSSRVLRSALKASLVSMWVSSMMTTLFLYEEGERRMPSLRERISSIPRLDAASISMTSMPRPALISSHGPHLLQGSPFVAKDASFCLFSQLATLAKSRAMVVLPLPRGP